MTCGDVVTGEVHAVSRGDSLMRASALMKDANVGFLPVLDGCGAVVGTLTDRDIVIRGVAVGLTLEAPVFEIMTHGAITCEIDDTLERVVAILRAERISRLICLENGNIIGVVSLDDLVREQLLPREVAAVEQALADLRT